MKPLLFMILASVQCIFTVLFLSWGLHILAGIALMGAVIWTYNAAVGDK